MLLVYAVIQNKQREYKQEQQQWNVGGQTNKCVSGGLIRRREIENSKVAAQDIHVVEEDQPKWE
jgi:hypothetical protein